MTSPPRIIFLDQNKWIDLLKAECAPLSYQRQYGVLKKLEADFDAHKVVLPLSSTNIYETYKIGDPERKTKLALLQARLSGGLVFRGRHARIESELCDFLSGVYELTLPPRLECWFLSDMFFEAFTDVGDKRNVFTPSPGLIDSLRRHPATALFHYLTTAPDNERLAAVKRWSDGTSALCARVEELRERHKGESLAMRKRIYSTLMMVDELPLLAQVASKYGVQWNSVEDIGDTVMRRIVNEMPIYYTERELVVRLEAQDRPIHENDFRDVQAYCAAITYADEVIGENQLINLARQGGLGQKFGTRLETNVLALE